MFTIVLYSSKLCSEFVLTAVFDLVDLGCLVACVSRLWVGLFCLLCFVSLY